MLRLIAEHVTDIVALFASAQRLIKRYSMKHEIQLRELDMMISHILRTMIFPSLLDITAF
jgi:hypothetical protein